MNAAFECALFAPTYQSTVETPKIDAGYPDVPLKPQIQSYEL